MSKMMTLNFEQKPLKKGTWSAEEDQRLIAYINRYGIWNWNEMPKAAGLFRSGKSCRLRWMNYLRPDIKRGNFTNEEDELILNLHGLLGNRWSAIAAKLGGRTDNEIKNHWHTHLKKRYAVQETKQQVVQNPHQVEMKYDLSFFTSNSKNIILISPELSPSGFSSINSNPPAIEADHEIGQSFSVQDLEDQMWVDEACIDCPYVSPRNSSSEYSSLWTGNNINHQTIEENVNSSEDVYFQSSPMEAFDTMEYNINGATTYPKWVEEYVYSYTYSQIAAENNLFDCTGLSEEMPRLWEKEQSVPLQVTDQEDYFGVLIRGLWQ